MQHKNKTRKQQKTEAAVKTTQIKVRRHINRNKTTQPKSIAKKKKKKQY